MVNVCIFLTTIYLFGGLCGWAICMKQQTKKIVEVRKKYEVDHVEFMKVMDKLKLNQGEGTRQEKSTAASLQTQRTKMDLGNLKRFARELKNVLVKQGNQNAQQLHLLDRIVQIASQENSESREKSSERAEA